MTHDPRSFSVLGGGGLQKLWFLIDFNGYTVNFMILYTHREFAKHFDIVSVVKMVFWICSPPMNKKTVNRQTMSKFFMNSKK